METIKVSKKSKNNHLICRSNLRERTFSLFFFPFKYSRRNHLKVLKLIKQFVFGAAISSCSRRRKREEVTEFAKVFNPWLKWNVGMYVVLSALPYCWMSCDSFEVYTCRHGHGTSPVIPMFHFAPIRINFIEPVEQLILINSPAANFLLNGFHLQQTFHFRRI